MTEEQKIKCPECGGDKCDFTNTYFDCANSSQGRMKCIICHECGEVFNIKDEQ